MLKLVALPMVNQIACTRDELIGKLADVERNEFTVTIGGRDREDCELKRQVKPVLKQLIRQRIASVDHDLAAYGVDVAAPADPA